MSDLGSSPFSSFYRINRASCQLTDVVSAVSGSSDHGYGLTRPSCLLPCFSIHTTHSHSDNKHNNTSLKQTPSNNSINMSDICSSLFIGSLIWHSLLTATARSAGLIVLPVRAPIPCGLWFFRTVTTEVVRVTSVDTVCFLFSPCRVY